LNFFNRFWKNSKLSNLIKIPPLLFHADRRTDRDVKKLTVDLRDFANAPKTDTLQKNRKNSNVINARVRADGSLMTLSWYSYYKICLLRETTI